MKTRNNGEPCNCEAGSKIFAQSGKFQRHLLVHSGEKPYICAQCVYKAKFKSNLIKHIEVAHGGRRYLCDRCRKKSSRKKYLRNHMESKHNSTLDATLKCGMDASFKIKPGLEIFESASMYVLHYNRIADTVKFEVNKADTSSSLIKDKDTSYSLNKDKDTSCSLNKDKDTSCSLSRKVKRPPPYPSDSKKINVGKVFKWCQFDVYKNGYVTQQPISTKNEHELPILHSGVNKYLLPMAEMDDIGTRPRLDGVQQTFNADKQIGVQGQSLKILQSRANKGGKNTNSQTDQGGNTQRCLLMVHRLQIAWMCLLMV